MIAPTIERVTVPPDEISTAVSNLWHYYQLPDGTEIVDGRALRIHLKALRAGYFERLVWPACTTEVDIRRWLDIAGAVLVMHRQGLV